MGAIRGTPIITIVTSKITITNIITMKKLEILSELPKCGRESEQMLLEKRH